MDSYQVLMLAQLEKNTKAKLRSQRNEEACNKTSITYCGLRPEGV